MKLIFMKLPIRKTCLGTLFSIYIVFALDKTACFADCSLLNKMTGPLFFFFLILSGAFYPGNRLLQLLSVYLGDIFPVNLVNKRHINIGQQMTSEVWFEG